MSTCAACGKGGDGLKACTGCGQVKYCNNACRKAHYKTHKKQCRQQRAGKKLATNDVAISCSNIDALSDEMNRIVISEMSCSKSSTQRGLSNLFSSDAILIWSL